MHICMHAHHFNGNFQIKVSVLAVACLTSVHKDLGSNHVVGSCVYCKTTVIYSLGHGLCTPFLQCLQQISLLTSVRR